MNNNLSSQFFSAYLFFCRFFIHPLRALSNMLSELSKSTKTAFVKTTPITFKYSILVKLNNENHLLLKQRVVATVRGHKLMNFLESFSRLQRFISSQDEENGNINLKFLEWEQQDQLLYPSYPQWPRLFRCVMVGCSQRQRFGQNWTSILLLKH